MTSSLLNWNNFNIKKWWRRWDPFLFYLIAVVNRGRHGAGTLFLSPRDSPEQLILGITRLTNVGPGFSSGSKLLKSGFRRGGLKKMTSQHQIGATKKIKINLFLFHQKLFRKIKLEFSYFKKKKSIHDNNLRSDNNISLRQFKLILISSIV